MPVTNTILTTSHADIALVQSYGKGLPVLFIHGNSSCKEAFRKQYEGALGEAYRMISMDLPGHGSSGDAIHPAKTYSMTGYANAAGEVLDCLGIDKAVIVGWSLGGHIAMEMVKSWPGTVGIMITGAPPVRQDMDSILAGFQPSQSLMLAGKNQFTPEDFKAFGELTLGKLAGNQELNRAMHRTDGNAREMNFAALATGKVSDQREIAETTSVPMAVVNGEKDPLVNVDYVGGLKYRTLWDEHVFVLRGLAHVPFLEAPEVFNPILARFLADMSKVAARPGKLAKGAKSAAA